MIAVDPASQRRGIGSALTDPALAEMRARGVTLAVVATGGDPGQPRPGRPTNERASSAFRRSGTRSGSGDGERRGEEGETDISDGGTP